MSRNGKIALSLVLFIAFSVFIYRTSVFRISKNFSVVEANKLYRSAQLTTEELEQVIKEHGIKTVISLRGSPGKTRFYEAEDITLARLKIKFVPIDMSDKFYPLQSHLQQLFSAFEKDAYPMLIHCRVGADRTGLAAALYVRAYQNKSLEESLQQLTFANWHVPLLRPAMTDFVRKFKGVNWAINEYRECAPEFVTYREPGYDCKN